MEKLLSLITLQYLLGLGSSCSLLLQLGLARLGVGAGSLCDTAERRARVTVPELLLWQLRHRKAQPNQGWWIYGHSSCGGRCSAAPKAPTRSFWPSHCPPSLFHDTTILCTSVCKSPELLDRSVGVLQMEKHLKRHKGRVTHIRTEAVALQLRCLFPICCTFHLWYIGIQ